MLGEIRDGHGPARVVPGWAVPGSVVNEVEGEAGLPLQLLLERVAARPAAAGA